MAKATKHIGRAAAVAGLAAVLAGCPAVPDIYFVGDASTDVAPQPADGAPPDVIVQDGGDGGGGNCPGSPPPGSICCGTSWCFDCQPAQHCTPCIQAACGAQTCCGKGGGNVVCKPTCP